jgi:hypothetical protein
LEAARAVPRFFINVADENGALVEKHGFGAFLGSVGSRVEYVLVPEEGGTDEGGGLVGVAEMLGGGGEEVAASETGGKATKEKMEKVASGVREGCTGRWNTYSGAVTDKKDRERWWHTERGRWREVTLS